MYKTQTVAASFNLQPLSLETFHVPAIFPDIVHFTPLHCGICGFMCCIPCEIRSQHCGLLICRFHVCGHNKGNKALFLNCGYFLI